MILVDTNILLTLLYRDPTYLPQVRRQFARIARSRLFVATPVLAEVTHFMELLGDAWKVAALIDSLPATVLPADSLLDWRATLAWLDKYHASEPDYADAALVLLTEVEPRFKVWTLDSEFTTIWRRPDGSRVPLAV